MKKVSLPSVIDFLNQINDLDHSVLPALIACRVPCNKEFAAHPTVQVGVQSSICFSPLGVVSVCLQAWQASLHF